MDHTANEKPGGHCRELTFFEKLVDFKYKLRMMRQSKIAYFKALAKRGFKRKTILFYPQKPMILWHMMYFICHRLGYKMTNDPNAKADLVMYFNDITTSVPDATLLELKKHHDVVNSECFDISKEHVEDVFSKVFGYGMRVDPTTATGLYVKKSDINARHDGAILDHPTTPEPGYIYQKLIDNVSGDTAIDMRTVVMNGTIPMMICRIKSTEDRFDNTVRSIPTTVSEKYTPDEIEKIIEFTKEMKLQYCELDVLRDNEDGKIYIVDVNPTPSGPPESHLGVQAYRTFLDTMATNFEKNFLNGQFH
jgi:hypothetical protein